MTTIIHKYINIDIDIYIDIYIGPILWNETDLFIQVLGFHPLLNIAAMVLGKLAFYIWFPLFMHPSNLSIPLHAFVSIISTTYRQLPSIHHLYPFVPSCTIQVLINGKATRRHMLAV